MKEEVVVYQYTKYCLINKRCSIVKASMKCKFEKQYHSNLDTGNLILLKLWLTPFNDTKSHEHTSIIG